MLLKGLVFLFLAGGAIVLTVVTNFGLKLVSQESRDQIVYEQFANTPVFDSKERCEKESLRSCTFRDCRPPDQDQVAAVCGKYILRGWYPVENIN